jgi:zinc protease
MVQGGGVGELGRQAHRGVVALFLALGAEGGQVEGDDVAAHGVTAGELEAAKTYLTGSFPLRFDGNGRIASILVGLMSEGLPATYVNDRNGYIEAVTLADVKRVAARLMQPEGLRFVVVGRPVGLETTN